MGVYDFALGYMYEIAHRELCTCAVSVFSHMHVRTAFGTTSYAMRERSTLLQHLPTTLRFKHSGECSTYCLHECVVVGRACAWYVLLRCALE
jgi:hypothetical protein